MLENTQNIAQNSPQNPDLFEAKTEPPPEPAGQTLRPYQRTALDKLRLGIKQGSKAQVLMMATGGGKTTVASEIAQGARRKGRRTYFVVDSLELVDQAVERFSQDGLDVGVIQGDHILTDYSRPVQVCTIQTLRNRWDQIAETLRPDVIIIDECHVTHQTHIKMIEHAAGKKIPVIGLSATPFRKGLGKIYDSMVVGATTAELIEQGYLCKANFYAPYVPDMKGVKTTNGDWQADALGDLMGDSKIVGDVVEHWLKHASERRTLVFAANVAHSRLLCDRFKQSGVNAEHIDGYGDTSDRAEIVRKFRRGEIQVLVNCAVLIKGFDAPEVDCLVIARPTKSLMLHIQMLGRGLRIADGKDHLLVLDHAGNVLRNGLPTDELPDTLDTGKGDNPDRKTRDKDEPVPKACIKCGHVSTKHKCPKCEFAPESRKDVEVRDGELYELGDTAPQKFSTAEVQNFYAELLGYAMQKRFKPGWAYHKCKSFAGRAPRNTREIKPKQPSEQTLNRIKHMNIKAAKRKEKQRVMGDPNSGENWLRRNEAMADIKGMLK